MIKEKIECIINETLKLLEINDRDILAIDINERTISHRFAVYLEHFFKDWHVDCEYNRDNHNKKILDLPTKNVETDDTSAYTVFPDIIVHKRGTNDQNLLVVEMKKSSNTDSNSRMMDIDKLEAFKKQLNYKFAVFIDVGVQNDIGKNDIKFISVEEF